MNNLKSEEYIEKVLVTIPSDSEAVMERFKDSTSIDMLHAAMGMVTEAAEIMDMLKKHLFYGKDFDFVNIEEELGDSDWYHSFMIHTLRMKEYHTSWEKIWEKNINKLKERYGDKFSEYDALNRDLDEERRVLEECAEYSTDS